MPKSKKEERFRWIEPILDGLVPTKVMAQISPFGERTIKRWLSWYRHNGVARLEGLSKIPRHQPRKYPNFYRQLVIDLRQEEGFGPRKIAWRLKKTKGIAVSPRYCANILKSVGLSRKYRPRRKNTIYKYSHLAQQPGDMIEVDVKWGVRLKRHLWWYQYTAMDVISKWRYLYAYDDQANYFSLDFLHRVKERAPFELKRIKTDNHAIFTNRTTGYAKSTDPLNPRIHPFDLECEKLDVIHLLIDPGKPQQNPFVERSHRSDKDYFYKRLEYQPQTLEEYRFLLSLWCLTYNTREHESLNGLSPLEYLRKVPHVYA